MMEATTIQKYIHTTPRKLRLVADMVREMTPNKALDILAITKKYAAKEILRAINTAISNAKQDGADIDKLTFKKIEINEGPRMKRYRASARGRARPYSKKMAHIKIVLSDGKEGK